MRHSGVTRGKKVGVVGLGGLGHMAVKFAHALGAQTVVFTTSPHKKDDALRLGADEVVLSRDANEMACVVPLPFEVPGALAVRAAIRTDPHRQRTPVRRGRDL